MVYPQEASKRLSAGRALITSSFTWMYVGANQFAIMIFILYTAVRYGHIKLGTKQSLPEFSDVEYFAMLFSAGVGVGVRCLLVVCVLFGRAVLCFFLKHGGRPPNSVCTPNFVHAHYSTRPAVSLYPRTIQTNISTTYTVKAVLLWCE